MDLSNEKESRSVDPTSRESSDSVSDSPTTSGLKSCADCRTTKTPLWRGGPNGPKSLCNACGIRFRKKRREGMVAKEKVVVVLRKQRSSISSSSSRRWKQRRWGEEEQAAVLLMALSTGLFYAS